ncbi:transmembrane protein 212 [Falco cherrug]|uniref:transmembrane protein 212 n=1 Tax=Falco cherrug TaxID=345164 RepID=UPI00247ABCF8|nr:transmembrane protein 212 [Falco cherrug]
MKVKGLYEVNRSVLITFGVISIFSGILPFSPAFSYKLWFFGWSVCLASAICNGALVGRTNALSNILLPFPYTDFPNLCRDPSHHEWYHLSLQIQDLCLSSAIFHASSGFVMTFGCEQDTRTETESSEAGPEEAARMRASLTMGFHLTGTDLSVEIKYETVVASIVCILGVALN